MTDLSVLEQRPGPGRPRAYDFPDFQRMLLPNGLTLIRAHVPGRPLLQAQVVVRGDSGGGATTEAPGQAGVTMLAARAMSEGTMRRDAVAFVEASERLGASLGASAGWDSLAVQVEVPRTRLRSAMELLAEMTLTPSFPEREVERLREERLNDLRQTMADARRRVDRLFPAVIYADGVAYGRLLSGSEETVPGLDREVLSARHARLLRAEACTVIVCGISRRCPSTTSWRRHSPRGRMQRTSSLTHPGPRGTVMRLPTVRDPAGASWSWIDLALRSRSSASVTSAPPGGSMTSTLWSS